LIRLVKRSEFLVVTTPSKVAMVAVSKLLSILNELKLPIIGVVENMKMKDSKYIKESISKINIKYLGHISFDHNLEDAIGNSTKLLKIDFMKQLDEIILKNILRL